MAMPDAAPGYFFEYVGADEATEPSDFDIRECWPFEACVGSCCTADEKQSKTPKCAALAVSDGVPEYGNAEVCPGGRDNSSCAPGYEGPRCSKCVSFKEELDCEDMPFAFNGMSYEMLPNGYYRLGGNCEPCPCTFWTLPRLIPVAAICIAAIMALFEYLLKGVGHLSTVFAPFTILITFCQTLALLLDLKTPWPPKLKALMQAFSILNFNMEMAKPDCSGSFGLYSSLLLTLLLPLICTALIGAFAGIKLMIFRRNDDFAASNQGKTAIQVLTKQAITLGVSAFMFLSVFMFRNIITPFSCTPPDADGKAYVRAAPSLLCDTSDPEYSDIYTLAWVGLL